MCPKYFEGQNFVPRSHSGWTNGGQKCGKNKQTRENMTKQLI